MLDHSTLCLTAKFLVREERGQTQSSQGFDFPAKAQRFEPIEDLVKVLEAGASNVGLA